MANGYVNNTPYSTEPVLWQFGATLGRVAGHSRMAVYGRNTAPAAGEDVWEGNSAYTFLAAASKLELLSASANDTAAGTGARSFTITGLDANFMPLSETIAMSGVTPVVTVNTYLRVNSMAIASAGSGQTNAGIVTLRVQGGGTTQAIAAATFGYAKQCVFTVPASQTLLVTDVLPECGISNTNIGVALGFTRFNPVANAFIITNEYTAVGSGGASQRSVITGAVIPSTWSLTLRITGVTGAAPSAYGSVNGILIDNTQLV